MKKGTLGDYLLSLLHSDLDCMEVFDVSCRFCLIQSVYQKMDFVIITDESLPHSEKFLQGENLLNYVINKIIDSGLCHL